MNKRRLLLFIISALFVSLPLLGCSGGGSLITSPEHASYAPYSPDGIYDGANRYLWGYWIVSTDASHSRLEITPVREAAFHLNARIFLEETPCTDCIRILDVQPSGQGSLLVDIELRHPFLGMKRYTGFDVRGIFMAGGALEFTEWGLNTASPDTDLYLKNPDGYTRLYNPVEFPPGSGPQPIYEYSKGKFASESGFNATLNAYKNFYTSKNRYYFAAGDAVVVKYDIKLQPGPLQFGYAVDACWREPGWVPPSVPDDFAISANCLEPYMINAQIGKGMTDHGGHAEITIDVYDWQGLNTIDACKFIAPDLFNGEIECTLYENSTNFRRYSAWIENEYSAVMGEYPVLIKATDIASDPHFGHVGAYQIAWAEVDEWRLPDEAIFVDNSSTSVIEDGTPEHPYHTIQGGVSNCPPGWQVWVDDSGIPYDGSVKLIDDVHVKGENWDLSDGWLRPSIDPPDDISDSCCFTAYQVSNVTIETFDCYPGGPMEGYSINYFIQVGGCGDITIRDCLFTGRTELSVIPCNVIGSANITIEYCRFDDLDRIEDEYGMFLVYPVYMRWCDTVTVRNSSFSDFRESEDEGSKSIDSIHIQDTTNPTVHNNVIFSIVPHAAVGYMGAVLLEGVHIEECEGPVVYNNTVSMLDSTEAFFINQCFAYMLILSPNGTFYNNIATHIYSSGAAPDGSPLARGVQSSQADLTCDYTCIFDIKVPTGEGAHYFQLAIPGIGCIDIAPGYVAPDVENFDITPGGPAQMGHPDYVDWDDAGAPSGDPGNIDPDRRSRMGCHGGPDGETVGLLT